MNLNHLLVVDDSLTVRKLVEIAFRDTEVVLEFAASGQEGISKSALHPPDVVLLDYVLPDMKGTDVCRRLSELPSLQSVPIVLMSAKNESVRDQFADFSSVVDFISKPFTREQIASRLRQAVASKQNLLDTRRPPPPVGLVNFKKKEAAAKALFERFKPALSQIPDWLGEVDTSDPAVFFAKKLLTPERVDSLLEVLVPFASESLFPHQQAPSEYDATGQLEEGQVIHLLKMIAAWQKSGELLFRIGEQRFQLYWRSGAILLATCFDPEEYLRDSNFSLENIPPEEKKHAEEMQQKTGSPLFVYFQNLGHLSDNELSSLLLRQSRRLLQIILLAPKCIFKWRSCSTLPAYVENFGKVIPIAQLVLDRFRDHVPWVQVEQVVPTLHAVFDRSSHFTSKIRQLQLTSAERRALALIDGQASVQNVLDRSGLAAKEIVHTLFRLHEAELIHRRWNVARQKVMILEPDVPGIHQPMQTLMSNRQSPIELINIGSHIDAAALIFREKPAMVVINTSIYPELGEHLSKTFSNQGSHDSRLVAIVEPGDSNQIDVLSETGFDAVLAKPFHWSELESLLVS